MLGLYIFHLYHYPQGDNINYQILTLFLSLKIFHKDVNLPYAL